MVNRRVADWPLIDDAFYRQAQGMKIILTVFAGFAISLNVLFAADGDIAEPAEAVKTLYAEHLANKGILQNPEAQSTWEFRFGPELCEVLKKGDWGFDPLVFAQDHEIKDLVIKEIERDRQGWVLVLVRFENFGKVVRLIVAMNHTDHGYRIANIVEPETGIDLINDLSSSAE